MRSAVPRLLAGPLTVLGCSAGIVVGSAGGANAADANSCYAAPSDAHCTGAPVDVNDLDGDPCFADSYSLYYEYGYKGAVFTYPKTGTDQGWAFETWLDYSPACQSNFTYTRVIQAGPLPYHVSNKVRRAAGPDGGYVMEHADWYFPIWGQAFASPLVYSPHNRAASCLSTDSGDQIACTTGGPNNDGYY